MSRFRELYTLRTLTALISSVKQSHFLNTVDVEFYLSAALTCTPREASDNIIQKLLFFFIRFVSHEM